jgi:hypothetical protein
VAADLRAGHRGGGRRGDRLAGGPLVAQDYYRRGVEINKQLARERALLPAMQGRNHAATPAKP